MFAVLSATHVYAQSGVNNNSDWHVPPQVPTIPQAPAVTIVAPVVTPLELTVTPVATIGGAVNVAPTLLEMPVMPPVPTAAAIAAAAPTVAAPTAAQIAAAPAGGAAAGGANAQVAVVNVQPIPTLPPVPPVPPIPDLQLSL